MNVQLLLNFDFSSGKVACSIMASCTKKEQLSGRACHERNQILITRISLCNPNFCCQISETYGNIPRQAVAAYMSNCLTCALKGMQLKKAPLKPIISSGFLQRLQVAFRMTRGSAGFQFYIKLSYSSNIMKYQENFEMEHLVENPLTL